MVGLRRTAWLALVLAAILAAWTDLGEATVHSDELLPVVSVLLMGSEAESLAAEEVLFQMGIPHYTARSLRKARRAAMMLVSFGQVYQVREDFSEALDEYVTGGGVVIAQKPRDPLLAGIFGFTEATALKQRHEIVWDESPHPLKKYIDAPEEKVLRLGSYKHEELFWTVGYSVSDARVLARFEDGSAAITEKIHGYGRAIAIGGSLVDLVVRSYLDSDFGVQKVGSNAFEPSTDTYLLALKAAYEEFVPGGLTVSTTPPGRKGALILTHDIDAQRSFANMKDYAKTARRFSARSTFFVQTKYLADYYDAPFMTQENLDNLRRLKEDGFEIGSHTVSHTPQFHRLPKGEMVTQARDYRPQIISMSETQGATVRGEVWVSKNILENGVTDELTSFRSGHLLMNRQLISSLEEAGYRYDASMGAYHCACNFPFRQFRNRSFRMQSQIIEFPMTISDYDWVDDLTELVPAFKQIILKNAANGAPTTLLIHPTRKIDKLEALDQLLTWLPDDMWVGTVEAYGRFWSSRYGLNPRVKPVDDGFAFDFRTDRSTEEIAIRFNSQPDSLAAEPALKELDTRTVILPPLMPGGRIRLVTRSRPDTLPTVSIYSPGGPLPESSTSYTVAVTAGAESYDDYNRQGVSPIVRTSLSVRRPISSASSVKLWDWATSRRGEAEETENEAGLTLESDLSDATRIWLRLVNRTYRRKFSESTLQFNEPRVGVTLRHARHSMTYYFDSRLIGAFYSSPNRITDKSSREVVIEPALRYKPGKTRSVKLKGSFGRRVFANEDYTDIYRTNFYEYGTEIETGFRLAGSSLTWSLDWSLRRYSCDRDRTALRSALVVDTPVRKKTDLILRTTYLDAEFADTEDDQFAWGEALGSYSFSAQLAFKRGQSSKITVGAAYRLNDYKRGPYDMTYLAGWLGYSRSF